MKLKGKLNVHTIYSKISNDLKTLSSYICIGHKINDRDNHEHLGLFGNWGLGQPIGVISNHILSLWGILKKIYILCIVTWLCRPWTLSVSLNI